MCCVGFSLQWLLLVQSTALEPADFGGCSSGALERSGSAVVVQRLSCLEACGIFPDQGSNPGPLQCTEDSFFFFNLNLFILIGG